MRIVVLSDSHGNAAVVEQIIRRHQADAEVFLHLGDGAREFENAACLYEERVFWGLRGNCDWGIDLPSERVLTLAGVRLFFCHGHTLGVKSTLGPLWERARAEGCALALYGHTHAAHLERRDGITLMNPGSCSRPREGKPGYGIVDLVNGVPVCNLVTL